MRSFDRRRFLATCASLAAWAGFAPVASRASAEDVAPIGFIPLDDRPVTYQLPIMLGAIAGQPLVTPPRSAIGLYLQPGDTIAIADWLRSDDTVGLSALIASLDMVAYGGLVASRIPGVAASEAYVRLDGLGKVKSARNIPFVEAFGTIMRLAPTGVPRLGLAANYYATGSTVDAIQDYANLPDPPVTPEDLRKAAHLREMIGSVALDDYLTTRERNRNVDEWALQIAAAGGFDRIVIGQDDAGPVGLHLKDVAALERIVARSGIAHVAAIEPGADELGMVMLARAFARNARWQPTVRVVYSRADGGATIDRLEYVPIDSTIERVIRACGATRLQSSADIVLYVRVPDTNATDESAFEDALVAEVNAHRSVAVADLTFLSGKPGVEQQQLTQALIARGVAGKIDAFASWNTDANTIGTALPEAVAAGAGRRTRTYDARAHAQFMLDRYIDDYAFHQFVRPEINEAFRARGFDTTLLLPDIARQAASDNRSRLWPYALDLLASIYPQYADGGLTITLPWDRTFETGIDVRLQPRN